MPKKRVERKDGRPFGKKKALELIGEKGIIIPKQYDRRYLDTLLHFAGEEKYIPKLKPSYLVHVKKEIEQKKRWSDFTHSSNSSNDSSNKTTEANTNGEVKKDKQDLKNLEKILGLTNDSI